MRRIVVRRSIDPSSDASDAAFSERKTAERKTAEIKKADQVIDGVPNWVLLLSGVIGVSFLSYIIYSLFSRHTIVGAIEHQGLIVPLTPDDKLWLGRMMIGETGISGWDEAEQQRDGAAALWCVVTRHMTLRGMRTGTLNRTIRAFSQPVNPIWADVSACRDGRGCCGEASGRCSPSILARRAMITNMPWISLPQGVRDMLDRFVAGNLPNPIPGYNNFAAANSISSRSVSTSELPAVTIGGNTYIRDPGSLSGEVRVV